MEFSEKFGFIKSIFATSTRGRERKEFKPSDNKMMLE